jgi:glycosyltransferase involved in cell wall biosynthesis
MRTPILQRCAFTPLISVILPTRKRLKGLNDTLHSLFSLADKDNINFEVIVKVDFDDHETIDYIKGCPNECGNLTFIINSRKQGWLSMVDFVENMIDVSKGKWILNINDDMVFETQDWNTKLEHHLQEFKIYFVNTNGYRQSFPIYPKEIKNILGHISPHNQIDTYLYHLSYITQIEAYIDDVFLNHYQAEFQDQTHFDKADVVDINFATRDYHNNSPTFNQDINLILNYKKSNNT